MIDWLFERWYRITLVFFLLTVAIAWPLVRLEDKAERECEAAGGQYHCHQIGTVPVWVGKVIVFQPQYSCQCDHGP